jgi:hypothetical protein
LEKVAADLAGNQDPVTDAYRAFIAELADRPADFAAIRCVIVDDYGLLDMTTRLTLDRYLRQHAGEDRAELWVVFYAAAQKALPLAIDRPTPNKPYGHRRTELYQLDNLSAEQRRKLAAQYGEPSRRVSAR